MGMLRVMARAAGRLERAGGQYRSGDARRGEQLFKSEQCIQCHSFKGKGGTAAPDLSTHIDRDYTPAVMASLMWNHAPDMWAGMKKRGIVKAELSPESAADLFAYFVSARYFERPGDAARGKLAFTAKHCAECHGITTSKCRPGAPPVAQWESLADPVVLAQQMWNHGAHARGVRQRKLARPQMTGAGAHRYAGVPAKPARDRHLATNFAFPPSDSGEALFQSKGCTGCHTGKLALEGSCATRP
jgi:cytochrome c2